MKSTLPKAQMMTFTQFQSFFNMERFIDRGIPAVISFHKKEEEEILKYVKKMFQDSLENTKTSKEEKEVGQEESKISKILEAARKTTDIIMSESLYTMCLSDFLVASYKAKKRVYSDMDLNHQIIEFREETENVIPLSMNKVFSLCVSVITCCSSDKKDDDNYNENNNIIWETTRSKSFPDKYIYNETYAKNICKAFKGKKIYTFVQSPSEVVLFPPCCAKQGKPEDNVRRVAMWSVHNVISLSLNLIISDLSPTKTLDKRVSLSHSVKSFLCSALQKQIYKVQDESRAFMYFIEALVYVENICELLSLNFGARLHSYEDCVPKAYIKGRTFSVCKFCGDYLYGSAFYRRKENGVKDEFICPVCLGRIKDDLCDLIETVFIDTTDPTSSVNDGEFFNEVYCSLQSKFSFDPQFFEIFEIAKSILPPFSDSFYLNCCMNPKTPYKGTSTERVGIWRDWKLYFQEQIYGNEKIAIFLHGKEALYKFSLPVNRFYDNPIIFVLFLVHSFQEKEVDSVITNLYKMRDSRPCAYTEFIIKFLECSNARIFKAVEKEVIFNKIMEDPGTKSTFEILYKKDPSSVIVDSDKLSSFSLPKKREPGTKKEKTDSLKVQRSDQEDRSACVPETKTLPRPTVTNDLVPPQKKIRLCKLLSAARVEYDEEWLKEYSMKRLYLNKDVLPRTGQELPKGIKIKTEKFVVKDDFTIDLECFLLDIDKGYNDLLTKYRENLNFLSTVRLILSEMLSGIKSFSVSSIEWKKNNSGRKPKDPKKDVLGLLKSVLSKENDENAQQGEEFTLDMFYKLLRTRNRETGRLLLLDIFSPNNTAKYGWAAFKSREISTLFPYEKALDENMVNIFGFDFM